MPLSSRWKGLALEIVKDRNKSKEDTEGLCDRVKESHGIIILMTLIIMVKYIIERNEKDWKLGLAITSIRNEESIF